jgi:competence protein ComEA
MRQCRALYGDRFGAEPGRPYRIRGCPQVTPGLVVRWRSSLAWAAMRSTDTGRRGRGDTVAPNRLRALLTSRPPRPGAPPAAAARHVPPAATLQSAPEPPERSWDPGLPGARALIAVGVVAALVAAVFLWSSRPRPQPLPAAAVRPSLAAQPAATPTSPAALVVDVIGKVRHPGVVTLRPGARVIDAIKAAGGLRSGAGPGTLNLARPVVDGEQIVVGQKPGPQAAPVPPGGTAVPGSAPGAQLDLNTATVEQFDGLPGVGPVLAQRIVDYRAQHGGFRNVEELHEVTGIGSRKYEDIKALVRV